MAIENPFRNMKITSYYKYLLVLFGIAFLISLVYEVKGFDSKEIQHLCLWIIGTSAFIWILEEGLVRNINDYLYESHLKGFERLVGGKKGQMKYYKQGFTLLIIDVIIQLVIWSYVILYQLSNLVL